MGELIIFTIYIILVYNMCSPQVDAKYLLGIFIANILRKNMSNSDGLMAPQGMDMEKARVEHYRQHSKIL